MKSRALILATCIALAACASRPDGPPTQVLDRILTNAPGAAQPSKIVAAETAFEQAAVRDGQWTAFRRFAAPGAILHGTSGPGDAREALAGRADPAQSVRWDPRDVWVSCDARLAVSRGRLRTAGDLVGTFMTIWALQDDGSYRWTYDVGAPDDPQPAQRPDDGTSEDTIVVEAMDTVRGHVADCARAGDPPPPPRPIPARMAGFEIGEQVSPDGTLAIEWSHGPAGERQVSWLIWQDGEWQGFRQPVPGPLQDK